MSEFNKTMTDSQFANYNAITKPKIKSTKDLLKGELITEENDISKVNAKIIQNNVPLKKSQVIWNNEKNNANTDHRKANYHSKRSGGWFAFHHRSKRDSYRSQARAHEKKRNSQIPTLNKHKGINNKLEGELKTEKKEKKQVDNKIITNTKADATLVKQKLFYDNRQEECNRNDQKIKDYESKLTELKQELDELNKNLDNCNRTYHNKCSIEQRNKLSKKVEDRENEMIFLKSKQDEYLNVCNNGTIKCDELFQIHQRAIQLHKENEEHKQHLDEKHKICLDPYRNNCKAKYGELKSSEVNTKTQAKILKESFIESMESYDKHEEIISDHKKNTDNLSQMQEKVKEFGNGKLNTSVSQKKKYDETILTNILLTALASSLLYYTFIEL